MENTNYKNGLTCALVCAVIWGFLPIYWEALNPIDSLVVILYRIVLMTLTCLAIQFYQTRSIKAIFTPMFEDRRKLLIYIIAGILITANWSIYIWAVQAGYVIQASMGYFLEPLLVCFFGMIIYKEKANKWKKISMGLAVVGLLVMVIGYKEIPAIAVGLATTFAIYTAIKKNVDLPPFQSLLYETALLAPVALIIVLFMERSGIGAMETGGSGKFILLLFAGIATAIPMGMFSVAARKLPLLTLGLIQYIAPSIALVLGIFLFKEPFDIIQFSAFMIIWIGLVFFTCGEVADIRSWSRK